MIGRIKLGLFNATGVHKSPEEIINFCQEHDIDIILITETFLTQGRLYTDWLQYHNYAIRPDVRFRAQGGLSLLVRPELNLHIHQLPNPNRHTLSFQIGTYKFHGLYLPPSLDTAACAALLDQLIIDEHTIILGDLNARSKTTTGDHSNNKRGTEVLEPWLIHDGLHVWNGSLTRGEPTFRTASGSSIIDLFISREEAIEAPTMDIFDSCSLDSHHHLCALAFSPINPWPSLPTPNSPRQNWKLQRLNDTDVSRLYGIHFDRNTDSILSQLELILTESAQMIPNHSLIEQLGHDVSAAIYDALDHSVTRAKARPKSWKSFWTDELQSKADRRKEAYRRWRQSPNNIILRAKYWADYQARCEEFSLEAKRTQRRSWKQFCTKLGSAPVGEANSIIKRMRRNRQDQHTFSHPAGPQQAAETMAEHLSTVFGGERIPRRRTSLWTASKHDDIDHSPFPAEHIESCIKRMAPRKAPGDDHITGAMLKPIASRLSNILSKFFTICWHWTYVPISWRTAQVVPIYKKGNPTDAANYRPISLTSVLRKLLERCLLPKMLEAMPALDIAQGGFRHKRGSLDQAFALHMLIRQYHRQYGEPPVQAFLDIKQAYDSSSRELIWSKLQGNLPRALLHLLQHLFDDVRITVILQNHHSKYIHPAKGVLQGSILSPLLYATFINSLTARLRIRMYSLGKHPITLRTTSQRGVTEAANQALSYPGDSNGRPQADRPDSGRTMISALLYADDVALLGSPHDMVYLLDLAEQHSLDQGYRWHPGKCAVIIPPLASPELPTSAQTSPPAYQLYNTTLPTVSSFQYLGIPFTHEGIDTNMLINQRITKATGSMALLRQLGIHQYGIGFWPAIRTYRSFIRPILEYGLAITPLTAVQMAKLQTAQIGCIKMALNRNHSTTFPTIVPMVLTDLPSMQLRTRALQLKFVTRLRYLPVSTMARATELSFLWTDSKLSDTHWRRLSITNPLHQEYNRIRKGPRPPTNPVAQAIANKRDDEFASRCHKYKTIRCLRPYRLVDPILYLAASSMDRHRLIKWRMHWLPSYPLKDCACGVTKASREHYTSCLLLQPLRQELLEAFGPIPNLHDEAQDIDYIMNRLPRSDAGLLTRKWNRVWPTLLHVLRQIDKLSHKDEEFDEDEPAPEEALQGRALAAPTIHTSHDCDP